MSFCYKSVLRCASPSAFESGIFCLLFLLLKKSKSPKASEATNEAVGPNALFIRKLPMIVFTLIRYFAMNAGKLYPRADAEASG